MIENKLVILGMIVLAYLAGRSHQWYTHLNCTEKHYRRGYADGAVLFVERAVQALLSVPGQTTRFLGIARVTSSTKVTNGARHSVEDRGATTTRINTRGEDDA